MVTWKTAQTAPAPASANSSGADHVEDLLAEVDEPPDERKQWMIEAAPPVNEGPARHAPVDQRSQRRESLLTRQLHSETEHSDEDHGAPLRALSTQSTWSNHSTTSTAELTSDDGRSMPSPAISPPLPPTQAYHALPFHEKPLDRHTKIIGQDQPPAKDAGSERTIEATLGRKRCIMFACRGKDEVKPKQSSPTAAPITDAPAAAAAAPLKRKCTIKFACPSRAAEGKPPQPASGKRPASPPPPTRRPSGVRSESAKAHRGSDSTVTHASPKSIRKSPCLATTTATPTISERPKLAPRKQSRDSDDTGNEATRFHEFMSSEDEPEEWTKESSCHRKRLTVNDTLQKELSIRKTCAEAEEEVLQEEEEEEAEEEADDVEEMVGLEDEPDNLEEDKEEDESDHSDAGFHSDDEEGFAASDSEGENSDYEWWKPGGSTAATSVEHLDHIHTKIKRSDDTVLASSVNSLSSGHVSPRSSKRRVPYRRRHCHATSHAIPISVPPQAEEGELPDSTDFVCGTLDEDRPLEQAYINRMRSLEAAKRKARPQDIDPTFPTSDPEMDEEDDEDLVEPAESERENMMHGEMDDDEDADLAGSTLRRHALPRPRTTSNVHRSPPPPIRYHSPPPPKRTLKHVSPPPPKRARSPAPRKLFGQSPKCARSPGLGQPTASPPNTRRASPTNATAFLVASRGLAQRPQLTHTASLPRGGGFLLSRMGRKYSDDGEGSDAAVHGTEVPKRGAIDIVKGLEKKRQRRKEKLYQKLCAKAAAKGDKAYKVKPGKGCERMREVGLQLQEYHGKATHILSL